MSATRSSLFALAVSGAACSRTSTPTPEHDGPVAVAPIAHERGSGAPVAAIPTARITFDSATGPVVVDAEVVQSPGRLQKGLMYRKFMPAEHGMLFLMADTEDHHFWMHNTLIALDIMFIDPDLHVVGILENVRPLDETSRGVGHPSRFVLEVNGGWSKQHGVTAGTVVHFDGVEAAAQ
jgi:uncharacterized protein